ncbi:ComEA family DNA-binding protein [Dyella sp.]|uniref:ComEA family DNA-binding protein n=1 Tax=Dyella sp. TaxID=1869338 RepID=UPI002ED4ADC8
MRQFSLRVTSLALVTFSLWTGYAMAATSVNINTADAKTIAESLDGIGLARAQAIVEHRQAHGLFKSADELTQIKGIGSAVVERNRQAITFDTEPEKPTAKKSRASNSKRADSPDT